MQILNVGRFTTLAMTLALGLHAQTIEELDRQQRQLDQERWQRTRDYANLQKRAQQEYQVLGNAFREHVISSLAQTGTKTSPVSELQNLFENTEVRNAFRRALHGDLESWFKTVGKLAAEKIADMLSDEAPAWSNPELLQLSLRAGSQLLSMNIEAKQLDKATADSLRRQVALDRARGKAIDRAGPRSREIFDDVARDQALDLERWLEVGDRAFDKKDNRHDQNAEDRFFTAFPELAMCAKCREAAKTHSPSDEVVESFKNGAFEIRFTPPTSSQERLTWQRNQALVEQETLEKSGKSRAPAQGDPAQKVVKSRAECASEESTCKEGCKGINSTLKWSICNEECLIGWQRCIGQPVRESDLRSLANKKGLSTCSDESNACTAACGQPKGTNISPWSRCMDGCSAAYRSCVAPFR